MRYLIILLMLCMFLLVGCTEEVYLINSNSSSSLLSACPINAWCEEHTYTDSVLYLDYINTSDSILMEFT